MKKHIRLVAGAASLACFASAHQASSPVEWIPAADRGENMFYLAQRTPDSTLLLTPNGSFFAGLGLAAGGEGEFPLEEPALNQNKNFRWISGWEAGDAAEWGLWIEQAGALEVQVEMEASRGRYVLILSEQEQEISTDGKTASATFRISQPGMHVLQMRCREEADSAKLLALRVSGPAVENGAVLRKRWRPSAAHARFSSSTDPKEVRLVIVEMDARPGVHGFYAPITTPFGYYGPTWTAEGLVNTGFNFSLWSYGRGKQAPPVEQMSHLIAIGDPDAKFSGFSHEGTGVKIRGWEPLKGRQGQRQAFAVRIYHLHHLFLRRR
jgi:hypothetical protein